MTTCVQDVYRYIDSFAPFQTAMDFDNCGLLAGDPAAAVETALLALDITPDVVREAAGFRAQLIISHHPVIFHPLRSLKPSSAPYLLAENGIAAICAHTNLDMAPGGVNICLAEKLGLQNVRILKEHGDTGVGEAFVGETVRMFGPEEFARFVKSALCCDGLFYADGKKPITKVGLCSGGGSEYLYDAASYGCQAFVTGEAKHHELIDAQNLGVTLIAAGHFYTEDVVILPLLNRLQRQFPQVRFIKSERLRCPAKYL